MKPLLAPLKRLFLQILLLLGCYFISRCSFTLINAAQFKGLSGIGFFKLAFFALRYDLSAIFAVNLIYITLLLLPVPLWNWKPYRQFTQIIFILTNVLALLFELSDWAYFPYNFKRSTSDVLHMVSRPGDFWSVLPGYFITYWYVPVACLVFIIGLIKINQRICRATPLSIPPNINVWLFSCLQVLRLGMVAGISVIAIRGGLQYIPIGLRNAVQVTDSRYVPVVLNTPFSIISSYATPSLTEVKFMPFAKAQQLIPTVKNYQMGSFRNRNVVVIILESFSKEFTKLGGQKSYTPFLDSLMDHSLVCTQAYANAQTSAEGIPGILAGIPTLMEEAITTSNYGTDRIDALPGLLRKEGYNTSFYHGGTNGTMSFDIFASAAGFDKYYGRKEYANEKDYDGSWGIWDGPFLQYFARALQDKKEPFMASVFTLSSHPPYALPDGYREKFSAGAKPVYATVSYTDDALRAFFATAAQQPWFQNTLFVITPDHCSPQGSGGYYYGGIGGYAIPILFFAPGDTALKGRLDAPVQQLDILPSVLDYLHYDKPFFAFGNSIFRNDAPRFVINQSSDNYQWIKDGYLLRTNEVKAKGLYAFPQDSLCQHNLLLQRPRQADSALTQLKAFIQVYRMALIHNKLSAQ